MMLGARLGGIGLALLLAGCAAEPEAKATDDTTGLLQSLRDYKPSPDFDTTGADCAGRLYRDTAQTVSGISNCKNGVTVYFSGHTDVALPLRFYCDYALFYTGRSQGSGRIACSDKTTGDFVFQEIDQSRGVATAHLKDGREITLTYTQKF
jgi:hypothetical protein